MTPIASGWTVLDDMEDSAFPAWTLTEFEDSYGKLLDRIDPEDSTNQVLFIYAETSTLGYTSAVLPLKDPIADGETGTIYLRYYESNDAREYMFGFSDVEITPDGEGFSAPRNWTDFEGSVRMSPFDTRIDVRDGDAYAHTSADDGLSNAIISSGTWYDIWIVVYNETGTAFDEYAVYIQGGDYTEQTLLKVEVNTGTEENPVSDYFDTIIFRNGTTDSIKNVFIRTTGYSIGPSNSIAVYIDNIAQAPGVALDIFECPYIDCFPDENNDVDTSHWLGWLNIEWAPWTYAYSLNSWIYMDETAITNAGAWAYFQK